MHPAYLAQRSPSPFSVFVLILNLYLGVCDACAINKCQKNGSTTYTDQACPDGSVAVPFELHVAPADDPEATRQRHLADQQKLTLIQQNNARQDKSDQHRALVAAQKHKLARAQKYRCKKLETKLKTARQLQLATRHSTNKSKADQARLHVQQAEDHYEASCPDDQ